MYDLDELYGELDDFEVDDVDELEYDDDELDDDEYEVKKAKKLVKVVKKAAKKAAVAAKAGVPPKTAAKKAVKSAIAKVAHKEIYDDEINFDDELDYGEDTELALELLSVSDDEELENFLGALVGPALSLLSSPVAGKAVGQVMNIGKKLLGDFLSSPKIPTVSRRRVMPRHRYYPRPPYRRWHPKRRMYRHRYPRYRMMPMRRFRRF